MYPHLHADKKHKPLKPLTLHPPPLSSAAQVACERVFHQYHSFIPFAQHQVRYSMNIKRCFRCRANKMQSVRKLTSLANISSPLNSTPRRDSSYIYSVTSYSRMDQQLSEIVVATHSYLLFFFFQNLLAVNDAPFQINAFCLFSAPS